MNNIRKKRDDFHSKRHQTAFDKGVRAWFDGASIFQPPYRDVSYAHAWRMGWYHAAAQQDKLTALAVDAQRQAR